MADCTTVKELNDSLNQAHGVKNQETIDFLGDLIGYPPSETSSFKNDKAGKIHQKLFDLLYDRITTATDLNGNIGLPFDDFKYLIEMLMMKQYGTIYNKMHNQNAPTINKVYNYLNKLFKQQDKHYENKGLTNTEKYISDPLTTAAIESSGKVTRIIRATQELQSTVANLSAKPIEKIESMLKKLKDAVTGSLGSYTSTDLKNNMQNITYREHSNWDEMDDLQRRQQIETDYQELLHHMKDGRIRNLNMLDIPPRNKENSKWWKQKVYTQTDKNGNPVYMSRFDYIKGVIDGLGRGDTRSFANIHEYESNGYIYQAIMLPSSTDKNTRDLSKWDFYVVNIKKDDKTRLPDNMRNDLSGNKLSPSLDILNRGYNASELNIFLGDDVWIEAQNNDAFQATGEKGDQFRAYRNFNQLKNKPLSNIINSTAMSTKRALEIMDDMYAKLFNDIVIQAKEQNTNLKDAVQFFKDNFVVTEGILASLNLPADSKVEEVLNSIMSIGGLNLNMKDDGKGGVWFGNTTQANITYKDNYDITQYSNSTFWEALDSAIRKFKQQYENSLQEVKINQSIKNNPDATESEVDLSSEALIGWTAMRDEMAERIKYLERFQLLSSGEAGWESGDYESETNELNVLSNTKWSKHRTGFMNPIERLIGPQETQKYVNHIYRTLMSNQIKIDMLKVYPALMKQNPILAQWLLERIKMTMGDLTYNKNKPVIDLNAKSLPTGVVRRITNHFKKKLPWAVNFNYTEADAHKDINTLNMAFSSMLLGTTSAIGNFSQLANLLIDSDSKINMEAYSLTSDLRKQIAEKAGVLDFINSFNQYLAQGEAKGLDIFIGIKEVTKLKLFFKSKESKKLIIKNLLSDKFIKDKFAKLAKNSAYPEDVEAYLKLYLELMNLKKPTNEAEFKKYMIKMRRIKLLNRNLSMEQVNKMAMWKLQWQFEPIKSLTFSGVELIMRKQAAVCGVIAAREAGRFDKYKRYNADGSWEWDIEKTGGVQHPYFTPEAVFFARLTVDNTMFGMSPPHLPFVLTGSGRFWGQYKQYTWAQFLFEKKIFKNFKDAIKEDNPENSSLINISISTANGIRLAFETIGQYLVRGKNKLTGKGGDINLSKDSPETRALLKFFGYRMAVGFTVMPFLQMTGFIGTFTSLTGSKFFNASKSISLSTSLILMAFADSLDSDDEEEKEKASRMFMMLLLPPAISFAIEVAKRLTNKNNN